MTGQHEGPGAASGRLPCSTLSILPLISWLCTRAKAPRSQSALGQRASHGGTPGQPVSAPSRVPLLG